MQKILLCLSLLLAYGPLNAQEPDTREDSSIYKNAIYVELGGNALLSLNYERIFYYKNNWALAGRIGISPNVDASHKFMYPIELIGLVDIGARRNYLEYGIGITPFHHYYYGRNRPAVEMLILRFGYRYIAPQNNVIIRLAFVPLWVLEDSMLQPSFGLSIGKIF